MTGSRVVAVVPAHDEQERIGATVAALREFCDAVIVADDGSRDRTAGVATDAGATVLSSPRNAGKGAALARGIAAANHLGDDSTILLFCDADLGGSAASLRAIVDRVDCGDADLAVAAPPPSPASGIGAVEALSRAGIRVLTGVRFARPLSGQRALRAATARKLSIASRFGVETAMTIDALRAGLRVVEVECRFTHARTGRDIAGFVHRARQGADVAAVLGRRSLQRRLSRGMVRS